MHAKFGLWLVITTPAAWLTVAYLLDSLSYGQVLHISGNLSAFALLLVMAITPLTKTLYKFTFVQRLRVQRRSIGVACCGYAALHTIVYLHYKWGSGLIGPESLTPSLLAAWLGFSLLILLAATSNNASVATLGPRWPLLHRAVYAIAGLTFVHWLLAAFSPNLALLGLVILVLTQALRWAPRRTRGTKYD